MNFKVETAEGLVISRVSVMNRMAEIMEDMV